jgi:hypothetical protein
MKFTKAFSAAVAACAIAVFAACDAYLVGLDSSTGIIEIRVFRGPINPVQREGAVNDVPVALARVAAISGDLTRRGATDLFGFARLNVSSGSYRVRVEFCPGAMGLPGEQAVNVPPGRTVVLRFDCDTGIR